MKKILILILLVLFTFTNKSYGMGQFLSDTFFKMIIGSHKTTTAEPRINTIIETTPIDPVISSEPEINTVIEETIVEPAKNINPLFELIENCYFEQINIEQINEYFENIENINEDIFEFILSKIINMNPRYFNKYRILLNAFLDNADLKLSFNSYRIFKEQIESITVYKPGLIVIEMDFLNKLIIKHNTERLYTAEFAYILKNKLEIILNQRIFSSKSAQSSKLIIEETIEADVNNSLEKEILIKAVFHSIKIRSKTTIEIIFRKYKNLFEKSFIKTCLEMERNIQEEDIIPREDIIDFLSSELDRPDHFVRENRSDMANHYNRIKRSISEFSIGEEEQL